MTKFKIFAASTFLCAFALMGCASFNANTFNAENLAADAATTATRAFNQYYPTATNGVTAAELAKLNSTRDEIYAADRDLSRGLKVLNQARLDYVSNSADTNKTAVVAALQTVSQESGNIVALIKDFMPTPAPAAPKAKKVPTVPAVAPVFAPIPVSSATN